jgi:hypothetical protein
MASLFFFLLFLKDATEDDLILDIIVLVGTVCNDDDCATLLSQSDIINVLIQLLNGIYQI